MSDQREYIATLVSITNEQVEKADGSGTYPAKVLTFEKSGGNGTYEKKVPIAFLKKNTALGEKIKEAEESMVGQKVLLCTQGYNITHIGKPVKKSFSGGGSSGKSFGGGKSSSYEEGAKRGHAITNAVNIAIHQGLVNKDNILAQAQMILEVSSMLENGVSAETEDTTNSTTQKPIKAATKKAAGGDVQVDDFDF